MKSFFKSSSLAAVLSALAIAGTVRGNATEADALETVGRAGENRVVLPVNQVLTPAGIQVELPGLRPQVLALSPDRKLLATSGKTRELIIIDPITGAIFQ